MERPRFVALVPVKPPAHGKSRLQGVGDDDRRRLAAAFALDTVTACLAAPSVAAVLCVTDDARFATDLVATGCAVLPDGVADDLNESLRLAAQEAARRWPDLVPVAVCADLPALRPHDLEGALLSWPGTAGFVVDSDGTGSTMYVADTVDFEPRFGHHSRADHLAAGAREIEGALPTLRRDVDDLAALDQAEQLGLGVRTAGVLADLQTR